MTQIPDQAAGLAALHAKAFERPWDAAAIRTLTTSPGVFVLSEDAGFIMIRVVADEAEILTLAVAPDHRRRGVGARLVRQGTTAAADLGAAQIFLEVAADNAGAIALYERAGFQTAGRRVRYYARPQGAAVDALVLRKPLITPA